MEGLDEIIRHYGLEEDGEHVIIPIRDRSGKTKRCFLLKRRYLRLLYPDGRTADFPLEEIIEATIRYPDIPLREALEALHEEWDAHIMQIFGESKDLKNE